MLIKNLNIGGRVRNWGKFRNAEIPYTPLSVTILISIVFSFMIFSAADKWWKVIFCLKISHSAYSTIYCLPKKSLDLFLQTSWTCSTYLPLLDAVMPGVPGIGPPRPGSRRPGPRAEQPPCPTPSPTEQR